MYGVYFFETEDTEQPENIWCSEGGDAKRGNKSKREKKIVQRPISPASQF